jgi:hypothetical protein
LSSVPSFWWSPPGLDERAPADVASALITVSFVTGVGVVLAREPHLRDWLSCR